ncbi:hypothetical protein GC176_27400 [bacterium]|nr:hypothetical protein [bacterium]
MKPFLSLTLITLVSSLTGCAVFEPMQQATHGLWTAFKPSSSDYDNGDQATGEWDFVGIEGRGDRPMDREYDKLDYFLKSPKHREIERNLGIQ